VSLGWHQGCGLIAAATGALLVGLAFDVTIGATYAVTCALPIWWLAYLALLARQTPSPQSSLGVAPGKQWYPLGSLALWACALSVTLTLGSIFALFSVDYEAYRLGIEAAVQAFRTTLGPPQPTGTELALLESAGKLAAYLFVPSAAAPMELVMVAILLLGAKIVAISGRLPRPMPSFARDFVLPRSALLWLVAAAGFAGMYGWPRFVGVAVIASLGLFLALQGLATAHILVARLPARPIILGVGYAMIVVAVPWMLIGLALLGIAEMALSLRARALAASKGKIN
jgi:hypothetical protein